LNIPNNTFKYPIQSFSYIEKKPNSNFLGILGDTDTTHKSYYDNTIDQIYLNSCKIMIKANATCLKMAQDIDKARPSLTLAYQVQSFYFHKCIIQID